MALMAWLLSACSTAPRQAIDASTQTWQGRMGVLIETQPKQQMSATFALEGSAQAGQLDLFTPLGTTTATLQWSPTTANWLHDGRVDDFEDLPSLLQKVMGTDLPLDDLFHWMHGQATHADGWQVDLSNFEQGKIKAVRETPEPRVTLRIQLD
jgi:outer membrane lipoprotein LolB